MTRFNSRFRLSILSIALFAIASCIPAYGQSQGQGIDNPNSRSSFDIQLFVLIASAEGSGRADVPKVLDATIGQLNGLVPFRNFRVGMTLLGRFSDHGSMETSGAAAPRMLSQINLGLPAFYEFSVAGARIDPSGDTRASIAFDSLRFSLNAPVPNPTTRTQVGEPAPVVNSYRSMSLKCSTNLQEGLPTIVGTMNTGQPDEQLVFVALVHKSTN